MFSASIDVVLQPVRINYYYSHRLATNAILLLVSLTTTTFITLYLIRFFTITNIEMLSFITSESNKPFKRTKVT